jgi:AcrR family transcriptional regulator
MKQSRIDIGSIRRNQIVEAAIAIIAAQGLQNLSLSEIEQQAGMSRGQLTYYFKTKEEILLAVFDRLLYLLRQQVQGKGGIAGTAPDAHNWERTCHFLTMLLLQPLQTPEFNALQYTFLSQIGHRDDFRQRLANLYEEWRGEIARDVEPELSRSRNGRVSARTVASLIQAILQGLTIQRDADPDSYDRQEMLELCLELLGSYLRPQSSAAGSSPLPARKLVSRNGASGRGTPRRSARSSRVKHE